MLTRTYKIRFVSPAFLGNAEQDGQWRTPPIKALLRQWWRVAYAAGQGHREGLSVMRLTEARLFGAVGDAAEGGARKSTVRVRLDQWNIGTLKSWDRLEQPPVNHPETERTGRKVRPHAYLAYGPLDGSGGTRFGEKVHAAIQSGEATTLSLAFPEGIEGIEGNRLQVALSLMGLYGTLGGRSRNGWGSFTLTPQNGTPDFAMAIDSNLVRPWRDALALDWPHAIGADGRGPLVWRTPPMADWKVAMRRLAEIKIDLRTPFEFHSGRNAPRPEPRHWLAYPVTNHSVAAWKERGKGDLRLPNSLRFKLRPDPDGKLRGVIFHVPCLPPKAFAPDRPAIESVWQQVHGFLDKPDQQLERIPA